MVFKNKKRKTQTTLPFVYLQLELFHTEQNCRPCFVDLLGSVDDIVID